MKRKIVMVFLLDTLFPFIHELHVIVSYCPKDYVFGATICERKHVVTSELFRNLTVQKKQFLPGVSRGLFVSINKLIESHQIFDKANELG
jgi:hypothetical protein